MNNEMYLLVFSGSYLGHLAVIDPEAISPETLYRALYNQPLNDEDDALIAKLLLVAEGTI